MNKASLLQLQYNIIMALYTSNEVVIWFEKQRQKPFPIAQSNQRIIIINEKIVTKQYDLSADCI